MYRDFLCAAIIPAFNEELKIGRVLQTVPTFIDQIIVIDDASSDNTKEIVANYKLRNSKIKVFTNSQNSGVGYSVVKGYKYALEKNLDLSVILAGDGQMDPNYISQIFDLLIDKNLDVVKGNRLYLSKEVMQMPPVRLLGNLILTILNKISLKLWKIRDPQNGYVAVRLKSFEVNDFKDLHHGYLLETEFLRLVKKKNLKIQDINIPALYETRHSSLRIWTLVFPLSMFYFREFFRIQCINRQNLQK